MPMNEIKATYRITTPMFCSGVDQQKAELRLASFKGALRFWWRTLMWRHTQDVNELHKLEAELFGASDQNYGQSKVRLRMDPNQKTLIEDKQGKWSVNQWQAYTGYGLIETLGNGDDKLRGFFLEDQEFSLRAVISPDPNTPDSSLGQVRDALIALGLFGGLGGRSRKGWGSVQLERLSGATTWCDPGSLHGLHEGISDLLNTSKDGLPSYTAISAQSQYAIGPLRPSTSEAHKWISLEYKEYIRGFRPKSEREAFGLPRNNAGRNSSERRGSPLFIHIHEFSNGQAAPIVLFLPSQFLPHQTNPADNWSRVHSFVAHIAEKSRTQK